MLTVVEDKLELTCTKCQQQKPEDEFHRCRRNRSGRQSRCKPCQCAASRESRDPVKQADYDRRYNAEHREQKHRRERDYRAANPLVGRLRRGKNRAASAGLPFQHVTPEMLLADWERRGIDPTRCAYTGEPLPERWHLDHTVPLSHPDTPGHVVTNLVPCLPGVNRKKWRRHWLEFLADRAGS